jgi:translation initiation factor 2 subunit 1
MRKKGLPERGELVICKIKNINPNSAFAEMIEYGKVGMIHVSEVAKRWVRDIREFLKENQHVVCRVMYIEGDNVSLSVKRVHPKDARRKLNRFKKERKAEKMLELVAKKLKKTMDQAYEEIGFELQETFGSLDKAFELALKNPGLLKSKKIPEKWITAMVEIAKKSYAEKTYELKGNLKLICYQPNGIDVIKKALSGVKDFEVKYISSPNYLITGKGKNFKELETKMLETSEKVMKEVRRSGGEAEFELIER